MYIARTYEMITEHENIYREKKIDIPAPEFIVFYNGKKDFEEDEKILKLSDAFMDKSKCNLELTVRVININKGHNKKLLRKSESLRGYVTFISKVNENEAKGQNLKDAIKNAAEYCIDKNILKNFFKEHRSEVTNMLYSQFRLKDAKKVWKEEAREEGLAEGLAEGREEAQKKIAVNLLKKNKLTIEEISEVSGLTIDKVERLKADLN